MQVLKAVVTGDAEVGKTCSLLSFVKGKSLSEYNPNAIECYTIPLTVDGIKINLFLQDTAGSESYDDLRAHSYSDCNVVVVFFSLVSQASLDHVRSKWAPEARRYGKGCPIVLVGTYLDMRPRMRPHVTSLKGNEVAGQVGASKYVEVCATSPNSASGLYLEAVRVAIRQMPRHKRDLLPRRPLPILPAKSVVTSAHPGHTMSLPATTASATTAGSKFMVSPAPPNPSKSPQPQIVPPPPSQPQTPTLSPGSVEQLALKGSRTVDALVSPGSTRGPPPPVPPLKQRPSTASASASSFPPPATGGEIDIPPPTCPPPPLMGSPVVSNIPTAAIAIPPPQQPPPPLPAPSTLAPSPPTALPCAHKHLLPQHPLPPTPAGKQPIRVNPPPPNASPSPPIPIGKPVSPAHSPVIEAQQPTPSQHTASLTLLPLAQTDPVPIAGVAKKSSSGSDLATSPTKRLTPLSLPPPPPSHQQSSDSLAPFPLASSTKSTSASSLTPSPTSTPSPLALSSHGSSVTEDSPRSIDDIVPADLGIVVATPRLPPVFDSSSLTSPCENPNPLSSSAGPACQVAPPGRSLASPPSPTQPMRLSSSTRETSLPMLKVSRPKSANIQQPVESSEAPAALQSPNLHSVSSPLAATVPAKSASFGEEEGPRKMRPPTVMFQPGELQDAFGQSVERAALRGRTQKTLFGVWVYREIPLIPLAASNWNPSSEFYFLRIKTHDGKCIITFLTDKNKKVWTTEVGQGALLAVQDSTRFFVLKLDSPIGLGFLTREQSGAFILEFMKRMYEARNYKGRRVFQFPKRATAKKSFIESVPMPPPTLLNKQLIPARDTPPVPSSPSNRALLSMSTGFSLSAPAGSMVPPPAATTSAAQDANRPPFPQEKSAPPLIMQSTATATASSTGASATASATIAAAEPRGEMDPDVYHSLEGRFIKTLDREQAEKQGIVTQLQRALFHKKPEVQLDATLPGASPFEATAGGDGRTSPAPAPAQAPAPPVVHEPESAKMTPEERAEYERLMEKDAAGTRFAIDETKRRVEEGKRKLASLATLDYEMDNEFRTFAIAETKKRLEEAKRSAAAEITAQKARKQTTIKVIDAPQRQQLQQQQQQNAANSDGQQSDDSTSSSESGDEASCSISGSGSGGGSDRGALGVTAPRRKHSSFACILCNERMVDRVVVPCGHASFCSVCIQKWTDDGNDCCPTCRTTIGGVFNFQR